MDFLKKYCDEEVQRGESTFKHDGTDASDGKMEDGRFRVYLRTNAMDIPSPHVSTPYGEYQVNRQWLRSNKFVLFPEYETCDFCGEADDSVGLSGCGHPEHSEIFVCGNCDIDGDNYDGWCEGEVSLSFLYFIVFYLFFSIFCESDIITHNRTPSLRSKSPPSNNLKNIKNITF